MMASVPAVARLRGGASNTVFKSGPLFISSKGIGWTSWKKRWFILTRTSLVFFKSDPSALPQKGGEVNLTLGGIDLNNSGSVVVREDKKLLTVLFPDGQDGRAFTLKAETSEDLYEWKAALDQALTEAPNAALVVGHNGIFRSETNDAIEGREKPTVKPLVVGRPILLALEDIDGSPSFLEKALRFLEEYGTNVEGILRHSADVEEVERRVQEYDHGKTIFGSDEDPHVVGDCVKHVLRELPSSPVPASCCTALLEAYQIHHHEDRIAKMHSAISETFPEPNRRLLQRIVKMMYTISSHAEKNRMTSSAVAACMAPLLLRPLVAGECDLEDDFDVNTDDSLQLLAAATAANSAQAIITSLLEGYEKIFNVDVQIRCSPSADSRTANSIRDDSSDNEILALKNNGHVNNEKGDDQEDEDPDHALSGKLSESSGYGFGVDESDVQSPRDIQGSKESLRLPIDSLLVKDSNVQHVDLQFKQKKGKETSISGMEVYDVLPSSESYLTMGQLFSSMDPENSLPASFPESSIEKLTSKFTGSAPNTSRSTFWVRGKTRKKPASSSADSSGEDEHALRRLETTKKEPQFRIAMEARGNEILQASLERRKEALHERRFALEQDISRLQEQLQAERDLRAALEVGLSMSSGQFSNSLGMESEVCSRSRKTRAELEEIALAEADVAGLKQKVAELHYQLNQQRKHQLGSLSDLNDPCEHVSSCSSVRKNLLHDFDSALAFLDHERRRRNGEGLLVADCSDTRRTPAGSKNRQKSQNQQQAFSGDFKNTEVSMDDLDEDSATIPTTSRETNTMDHPLHPSAASSALIELTTRLDFFKERRSQLIDKLHNLDINYATSSRDFLHRSSSPSWN